MPDYREIYLIMARETERAINILIDAQKRCEDLYINAGDAKITLIDRKINEEKE